MDIDIGWVDLAMIAVLLISLTLGIKRGLVYELLTLLAWFVAYFVASAVAPFLAPHLALGEPGGMLNMGAAFGLVFFAVVFVWSMVGRLVRKAVHATPLQASDRALGGLFGLARALVALLVLAVVVHFTPFQQSRAWQRSVGAQRLGDVLDLLRPTLPSTLSPWLPEATPSLPPSAVPV